MNIHRLRDQIDHIDDEIVKLFLSRMQCAEEIAHYKNKNNLPVTSKEREREIIARVTQDVPEDLQGSLKILFNALFDVSRSYQERILFGRSVLSERIEQALVKTEQFFPQRAVVACQGTEGAYSQLACDKLFPIPSILYFKHFEGVFQAVQSGLCRYGMLPIENSSYGSVVEVYDLMKKYNFSIARSVSLQIKHSLLAARGTKLSDVREIVSHEQALGQCDEFLKKLKDVKITVFENTAAAAKYVSESKRSDLAAIASESCISLYNLTALATNIQDSDSNYTRFICISQTLEIYPGSNKISLMLSVPHRPGALYEVIAKFSALGVNLTKLESRPIPGSDFEFLFYLDLNASVHTPHVVQLLGDLSTQSNQFSLLGCYSEV